MKLSTLLLSSAALVVAGSAYAADLPAKKGAPAAKAATGCPAFGAGFFSIPGGDTCIKFSGSVYTDGTLAPAASSNVFSMAAGYAFTADARNNTDMGTLRSVATWKGSTNMDKAYVQLGGLSVGKQDAITKVYGAGLNTSGADYDNPGTSLYYTMPLGAANFSVGVANGGDTNNGSDISKNPDLQAAIGTSVGAVSLKAAIASHDAHNSGDTASAQGYAALASATAKLGDVSLLVFGGTATAASAYMSGSSTLSDVSASARSSGSSWGVQGTAKLGGVDVGLLTTSASVSLGTSTQTYNQTALFASFSPVKGFRIDPEYIIGDANGTKTYNTYVRIARDF